MSSSQDNAGILDNISNALGTTDPNTQPSQNSNSGQQLSELEQNIMELNKTYQTQISKINGTVVRHVEKLESIRISIENKINEIKDERNKLNGKQMKAIEKLKNLTSQIGTNDSIAKLQETVTNAESEVSSINSKLGINANAKKFVPGENPLPTTNNNDNMTGGFLSNSKKRRLSNKGTRNYFKFTRRSGKNKLRKTKKRKH